MQSQIWGDCVALANSPYQRVHDGMVNFTRLGIPANKLVLGVPWYTNTIQFIHDICMKPKNKSQCK
jgi:GH18 family chitinase